VNEPRRKNSRDWALSCVGDIDNTESLKKAFSGAYGAYCVTFFGRFLGGKGNAEVKAMAEAAKAAGLRHAIWSTLEDTRKWVPLMR